MTTQAAPTQASALTVAAIRIYHADPATQALKDKLFLARARAIIVRETVDALLAPAFAETDFRDEDTGERIETEERLYLTADDVDVSGWYARRDEVLIAGGYQIAELGVGRCPALEAEADVLSVEKQLLAHASAHFGTDFTRCYGENRKRAIELFSANVRD